LGRSIVTRSRRLYGLPSAEQLHAAPAGVWESDLAWRDDLTPGQEFTIEEWSVADPLDGVPLAVAIVENIEEWIWDEGYPWDSDPWGKDDLPHKNPTVLEATERLREAIAATVTYYMAERKVGGHLLVIPDDIEVTGNPIYDGERLYLKGACSGRPR